MTKPKEIRAGVFEVPLHGSVEFDEFESDLAAGIPDDIFEQLPAIAPGEARLVYGSSHVAWCKREQGPPGRPSSCLATVYRRIEK